MSYYDEVVNTATWLRARVRDTPQIGVVLGSGLGAFADRVEDARRFDYRDIPHWPPAAVVGHAGTLVAGRVQNRPVVVLSGRAHFYEGHDHRTE